MQHYQRNRQHFPLTLPRNGPRTELESLFEELHSQTVKPHPFATVQPTLGYPNQPGIWLIAALV